LTGWQPRLTLDDVISDVIADVRARSRDGGAEGTPQPLAEVSATGLPEVGLESGEGA
jgi:hypothetical protein